MAGKIKLSPDALSEILSKIQLRRINDGTHNFIRLNQKRIDVGIHNLLGSNQNKKQLADGKHASQIIVSFPHCNKIGSKIIMSRWHFDKCKEIK